MSTARRNGRSSKAPDAVIREAFVEAHARDPGRDRHWLASVDGNATQIEVLRGLACGAFLFDHEEPGDHATLFAAPLMQSGDEPGDGIAC